MEGKEGFIMHDAHLPFVYVVGIPGLLFLISRRHRAIHLNGQFKPLLSCKLSGFRCVCLVDKKRFDAEKKFAKWSAAKAGAGFSKNFYEYDYRC